MIANRSCGEGQILKCNYQNFGASEWRKGKRNSQSYVGGKDLLKRNRAQWVTYSHMFVTVSKQCNVCMQRNND